MGLDATAAVVLGASLEARRRQVEVTKYDEDTGKPYKKTVTEEYFVFSGTDTEVDHRDDWCVWGDIIKGYSYLIGKIIAETESHRHSNTLHEELSLHKEYWGEVSSKLKSLGFEGDPRLFVLQRLSY